MALTGIARRTEKEVCEIQNDLLIKTQLLQSALPVATTRMGHRCIGTGITAVIPFVPVFPIVMAILQSFVSMQTEEN